MPEDTAARSRKPFCFVTERGDTVSANVLDQYAVKAAGDHPNPASRQIVDQFATTYGELGLVQPLYNPEALAHVLELNTFHYRACKTKARDAAGMGWFLRPATDDESKADTAVERRIVDRLKGFSTSLTATLDQAQMDYESVGWAAIEVVAEADGTVIDLVHMPAHTLRRHQDGKRIVQLRGSRRRWFVMAGSGMVIDDTTGSELGEDADQARRAHEVMWWNNYTSRSDFYGLPDIIPALGAIHGDVARRNYNISFFDSHGVPAYAVYVTGDFDPGPVDKDGKSELQREIEQQFKRLAKTPNAVMTMVVPTTGAIGSEDGAGVKIEFEKLAVDINEASFRLYRIDNRDEILAAHGIPPYRLGIAEVGSLSGTTATESTEIYKRSVLEPRQQTIEELINRYVIQSGTDTMIAWEWKLNEIDTKDEQHDLDILVKLVEIGAATPREVARHFVERFGLSAAAADDDSPLAWHYIDGKPIDAPPGTIVDPNDVEGALLALRNQLMRAAAQVA